MSEQNNKTLIYMACAHVYIKFIKSMFITLLKLYAQYCTAICVTDAYML